MGRLTANVKRPKRGGGGGGGGKEGLGQRNNVLTTCKAINAICFYFFFEKQHGILSLLIRISQNRWLLPR